MGTHVIQASLTGGEIAPALQGRVDMALYATSLKTCRNFIVQPYGGVKNRPGTRFIANTKNGYHQSRLMPFQFNESQTYVLEFGDYYMRVFNLGARVLYSTAPSAWATGTAYVLGDAVLQGGAWYQCKVKHTSSALFATDAANWTAIAAGDPTEFTTIYPVADLPALNWAQSADVITIVHPNHPPMQLSRLAHDRWTLEEFAFQNGPFLDVNTDLTKTVSASGASGEVTLTASASIFASPDVGRLIYLEQKDYGTPWEVGKTIGVGDIRRSDGKYYQAINSGTTGTLRPTHQEDTWSDGGVSWLYLHSGWGIAQITAYTSGTEVTANVLSRIPDSIVQGGAATGGTKTVTAAVRQVTDYLLCTSAGHGLSVGLTIQVTATIDFTDWDGYSRTETATASCYVVDANSVNIYWIPSGFSAFVSGSFVAVDANTVVAAPSYKWALGAWGGDQGWPSCVTYFQQRQFFAATQASPRTIWASRTGNFLDFGRSNPMQDDDRITAVLASGRMDEIKFMHSMENLVVLTAGGEMVASSGQDDVLKPNNISFKVHGWRGSSSLPVLGVGNTALFLQSKGQIVRDLAYEFSTNSYSGFDRTAKASHLLESNWVTEWAYQQTPIQCVWAVRNDGVLLGLTYMREQEVAGWHRHDTDGTVESVCVVSEGQEDVLYLSIKRIKADGTHMRCVERMESRLITEQEAAFFVDSGLSYDGRNTGVTSIELTGGTTWDETDTLTAVSSVPEFSIKDLGDEIVYIEDGIYYRLTVTAFTDTTHVSVRPNRFIPELMRLMTTDWAWARNTMAGLDHLIGKTVSILADASVQPPQVVGTDGSVTISPPSVRVHVGLPITADLETLDLNIQGVETILPKNKSIPSVTFLVHESRTISAGRDFDNLVEFKLRSTEGYDQPINLQTGKVSQTIPTNWGKGGQVCLRVTDPLPVSVLAIIPNVIGGAA